MTAAKGVQSPHTLVGDDVRDVEFRGQTFAVEREILSSARFLVAMAAGQDHRVLCEILRPEDLDRFLHALERGDRLQDVAEEFFAAVSAQFTGERS